MNFRQKRRKGLIRIIRSVESENFLLRKNRKDGKDEKKEVTDEVIEVDSEWEDDDLQVEQDDSEDRENDMNHVKRYLFKKTAKNIKAYNPIQKNEFEIDTHQETDIKKPYLKKGLPSPQININPPAFFSSPPPPSLPLPPTPLQNRSPTLSLPPPPPSSPAPSSASHLPALRSASVLSPPHHPPNQNHFKSKSISVMKNDFNPKERNSEIPLTLQKKEQQQKITTKSKRTQSINDKTRTTQTKLSSSIKDSLKKQKPKSHPFPPPPPSSPPPLPSSPLPPSPSSSFLQSRKLAFPDDNDFKNFLSMLPSAIEASPPPSSLLPPSLSSSSSSFHFEIPSSPLEKRGRGDSSPLEEKEGGVSSPIEESGEEVQKEEEEEQKEEIPPPSPPSSPPPPPPTIVNLRAFLSSPPPFQKKEVGGREEERRRDEEGKKKESKKEGGRKVMEDAFWKEDVEEEHRKVKTRKFAQKFYINVDKNPQKESMLISKIATAFGKKLDARPSLLKSKIKDMLVKKKEEGFIEVKEGGGEDLKEGGELGGKEEGGEKGEKTVVKKEGLFELIKKLKKKESIKLENPYENLACFNEEIRLGRRMGSLIVFDKKEEEGEGDGEGLMKVLENAKKKKIGEVKKLIEEMVRNGKNDGMEVQICKLIYIKNRGWGV